MNRLRPAFAHWRPLSHRPALTLVETLLGLMILAMVMLAMGGASEAVLNSWRITDSHLRAQQAANMATFRIVSSIRQCVDCQVGENAPAPTAVEVTDNCVLKFLPTPESTAWQSFRLRGDQLLYCATDTGPASSGVVLARGVSAVQFTGHIAPGGIGVDNVQIRLSLSTPSSLTTSDSAILRRKRQLQ